MARSLTRLATRYRAPAENGESGKCALVGIAQGQKQCPINAVDGSIYTAVQIRFEHQRHQLRPAGWVSLLRALETWAQSGLESTRAAR